MARAERGPVDPRTVIARLAKLPPVYREQVMRGLGLEGKVHLDTHWQAWALTHPPLTPPLTREGNSLGLPPALPAWPG